MATAAASIKPHAMPGATRFSAPSWRLSLIIVGLLYVLILAVYRDTSMSVLALWNSSDLYGHGFLVLPAAVFLLWKRRHRLQALAPRPSFLGPVVLAFSALVWLVGEVSSTNLLQHLGLVAMLPGVFVSILGVRIARACALPLGYLVFAVPFGGELIPALQQFTGAAVASVLGLSGIPVFLEANFLIIPNGRFEIAEACAGARSLIATVAAATLGSDILYNNTWKRVAFVAFAIALAIVANAIRAYLVVAIAAWRGLGAGVQFDHVTFGLVFLSIVLVLLFAVGALFRDAAPLAANQPADGAGTGAATLSQTAAVCLTAFVAATALQIAAQLGDHLVTRPGAALPEVDSLGIWQADASAVPNWRAGIANPDAELLRNFTSERGPVTLHVAYFSHQRPGAELINDGNRHAGTAPWRVASTFRVRLNQPSGDLQLPCSVVVDGIEERISCHAFWVNGALTGSVLQAKVRQALARLTFGLPAAAVVSFSWPVTTAPMTDAMLTDSLSQTLPAIVTWLADAARAS